MLIAALSSPTIPDSATHVVTLWPALKPLSNLSRRLPSNLNLRFLSSLSINHNLRLSHNPRLLLSTNLSPSHRLRCSLRLLR